MLFPVLGKGTDFNLMASQQTPPLHYRFKKSEAVADGVRRIAVELLERARFELLSSVKDNREEGVHDLRKRLKELRALLRLVRNELGDDTFSAENLLCREWGRSLSGYRDASVAVRTFTLLFLQEELEGEYAEVSQGLLSWRQAEENAVFEQTGTVHILTAGLAETAARYRLLKMAPEHGFPGCGLQVTYRRGQMALKAALEDPTDENLHDWRKRVKDLRYQLQLCRDAWPEGLGPYEDLLHRLSDLLGEDHDLAMLHVKVADHVVFATKGASPVPANRIRARRHERQHEAFNLGRFLFAEKPAEFSHRINSYWSLWRER